VGVGEGWVQMCSQWHLSFVDVRFMAYNKNPDNNNTNELNQNSSSSRIFITFGILILAGNSRTEALAARLPPHTHTYRSEYPVKVDVLGQPVLRLLELLLHAHDPHGVQRVKHRHAHPCRHTGTRMDATREGR
jgi:hypothetical protein